MIRIEYNEDAFTSWSIGLYHPVNKLHICLKSSLCDWLCTISRRSWAAASPSGARGSRRYRYMQYT
eukprot:scaffold5813_cov24-Phaeocystis_antarctica.AAC.1